MPAESGCVHTCACALPWLNESPCGFITSRLLLKTTLAVRDCLMAQLAKCQCISLKPWWGENCHWLWRGIGRIIYLFSVVIFIYFPIVFLSFSLVYEHTNACSYVGQVDLPSAGIMGVHYHMQQWSTFLLIITFGFILETYFFKYGAFWNAVLGFLNMEILHTTAPYIFLVK